MFVYMLFPAQPHYSEAGQRVLRESRIFSEILRDSQRFSEIFRAIYRVKPLITLHISQRLPRESLTKTSTTQRADRIRGL